MSDEIRLTSFRWSEAIGDVIGYTADGDVLDWGEWTMVESDLAIKACHGNVYDVCSTNVDTVYRITPPETPPLDNEQDWEGDNESDADPDQGEDGGERSEQGDGDGEDGDGGEQSDNVSEETSEDGEGELTFEQMAGEDDSFDHALADDLWTLYHPRVVQIAENRVIQGVDYARRVIKGGGNGGGLTIRVSGRKTGNVDGLTHFMFPKVLAAVSRGVNVYLPGPPGTGKSFMTEQIGAALGKPYGVTSFSPMSTESKLLGFRDANGHTVRTTHREAYEHGWVMCYDELDNANPAIVTVMNGGLAASFMEFPDGVVRKHDDYVAIATANTFGTGPTAEFAGRQKLDPATLNRFVKIFIGTDEALETLIVEAMIGQKLAERWLAKIRHNRRAVEGLRIKHFITMRDSINGAKLIAPGDGSFDMQEALELTCLGVLTEDQRAKLKGWKG